MIKGSNNVKVSSGSRKWNKQHAAKCTADKIPLCEVLNDTFV